jgi:glyoxylase-like metal-dependent hydrolase (beta-lactamase superfamily II)
MMMSLIGLILAVALNPLTTQASAIAPPPALETGVLPASWAVLKSDCVAGPAYRSHEYNPTFIIIRQSGCTHYEKPFLYLLIGTDEALLFDTGAPGANLRPTIDALMQGRLTPGGAPLPLLVLHSHGHGDHVAGDGVLAPRPNTRLIAAQPAAIAQFFGLTWPTGTAQYDLGSRLIDIVPIPGHEAAHVAVYDRRTGVLLTGDTLYPGRLYVSAQQTFRDSVDRLVDFTLSRPIAHVFGGHIEQKRTPFVDYPVGTTQQPEEHVLELGRSHLVELQDALRQMPGTMLRTWLRDFTVWP